MATKSRETLLTELRTLASGVRKHVTKRPITFNNRTYGGEQIAKRIQTIIDAEIEVTRLAAELAFAHRQCKRAKDAQAPLLSFVRKQLLLWHGHQPGVLADLGLSARRPMPKRTAKQRVLMREKNLATRAKRGTLGPKQKKAIRGNVTGVTITPIVADGPRRS